MLAFLKYFLFMLVKFLTLLSDVQFSLVNKDYQTARGVARILHWGP